MAADSTQRSSRPEAVATLEQIRAMQDVRRTLDAQASPEAGTVFTLFLPLEPRRV